MRELRYAVVIPTLGRPSLRSRLAALAAAEGPRPEGRRRPGSTSLTSSALVPAASLVLSGDTGVAHVPRLEPDFPR